MKIYHNSWEEKYRSPFGAAKVGESLRLSIAMPEKAIIYLHYWIDGFMDKAEDAELHICESSYGDGAGGPAEAGGFGDSYLYTTEIKVPDEPGLLWYYFIIKLRSGTMYYGNSPNGYGGEGSLSNFAPVPYQVTVYKESPVPKWFKEGIVYQIFPDRFNRGSDWNERVALASHPAGWRGPKRIICQDWNDTPFYMKNEVGDVIRWPFFGGTLSGIDEKLAYLANLGVAVIYLNPIFEAASNHRYDTGDFMKIDPMLGDEASFVKLCGDAERYGIRIILDGVFNHTGRDSIYFDAFRNYTRFNSAEDSGCGADCTGGGADCTGGGADCTGGGADCTGGGADCAACDKAFLPDENSPYREWFKLTPGQAPGYQCWWGIKDLPDVDENNPGYREFICGEKGVVRKWLRLGASGWRLDVADELPDEFIKEIRKASKLEKPDSLLMGEVWEDASNKVSYGVRRKYFSGDELDSTMHYPFREMTINFIMGRMGSYEFKQQAMSLCENYPPENYYGALNLIGSHDRRRIMTVLGEAPELPENQRENFRLDEWYHAIAVKRLRLAVILQFAMPGVPCIYYGDEAGAEGYEDPYCRGTYPWGMVDENIFTFYKNLAQVYHDHPVLKSGSLEIICPDNELLVIKRSYEGAGGGDVYAGGVDVGGGEIAYGIINRSLTRTLSYNGISMEPLTAKIEFEQLI